MMLAFYKVAEKHGTAQLSRAISKWAAAGICRLIKLSTYFVSGVWFGCMVSSLVGAVRVVIFEGQLP